MQRPKAILLSLAIALSPLAARAQMWGSGQWGGMQGCSYPQQQAAGAASENEDLQEAMSEIQELKAEIKEKKSELKNADRQLERSRSQVSNALNSDYAEITLNHIENGARCNEYQSTDSAKEEAPPARPDLASEDESPAFDEGEDRPAPPKGRRERPAHAGAPEHNLKVPGISSSYSSYSSQWAKFCDPSKAGAVRESICSSADAISGSNRDARNCKKALVDFRKNSLDSQKLQTELERMQNDLDARKQDLADLKKELREERRDETQGEYCEECQRRSNGYAYQNSTSNLAASAGLVGAGLLTSYMGYKTNKIISENNAALGYPTQSNYSALGYGMPYIAAGIYGAVAGGSGQGGFGCGGTGGGMNGMGSMGMNGMMMGGAFGYPSSMMGSSMGGGMYMNPYAMSGMSGMGAGIGMNFNNSLSGMNSNYAYQQALYQMQMASLMSRLNNYGTNSNYLGANYMNGVLPAPSTGATGVNYYNSTGALVAPSTTYSSGVLGTSGALVAPTSYLGR